MRRCRDQRPTRPQRVARRDAGFTLVEVLVAMAIVSMIAVAGSVVLVSALNTSERFAENDERLKELDLARQVIERDLLQVTNRAVREPFGEVRDFVFEGGLDESCPLLAFTRNGWENPEGLAARSDLQFVEYCLVEDRLVRRARMRLDVTTQTPENERILLTGVRSLEVLFPQEGGRLVREWRQTEAVSGAGLGAFPRMVIMSFELDHFGPLELRFLVHTE